MRHIRCWGTVTRRGYLSCGWGGLRRHAGVALHPNPESVMLSGEANDSLVLNGRDRPSYHA
jgi:hypothetical protein